MYIHMIVTKSFYINNDRYYIDLDNEKIKVPYRYNRVMCKVHGLTPVQDMKVGDVVKCTIEKKMWQGYYFKVLKDIEKI